MFGKQNDKNNAQQEESSTDDSKIIDTSVPLPDHPDVPKDLMFLPPSALPRAIQGISDAGLGALSGRSDLIGSIARETAKASSLYSRLSQGDISAIGESVAFAKDTANQVRAAAANSGVSPSIAVETKPSMGPGAGDGYKVTNGGVGFSSAHHLSLTPDPTSIRFTTDISQIFYTPNYSNCVQGYYQTVFATGVLFQLPASGNSLADFNNLVILNELRNKIARNINYPLSQVSTFSNANLLAYFNNLLGALSIYYAAKRFLVWGSMSPNRVDGLYYMANSFTAADISAFGRLERMLEGIPIPPKMNEFLFWAHQLYSSGGLSNDPVIMIDPISMSAGVPQWTTDFTSALNLLNTSAMLDIANGLARAFPNWSNTTLYTGNANLEYDKGFCTFWRNLPFRCAGTSGVAHDVTGPSVANDQGEIRYNSWDSDLDGAIPGFAAVTTSATGAGTWLPSLVVPKVATTLTAGNSTNRYHYENVSGVSGWYDSYNSDGAAHGRDETYTVNVRYVNALNTTVMAGSQVLKGVTGQAILETSEALVDFWIDWDNLPGRAAFKPEPSKKRKATSYNRRKKK